MELLDAGVVVGHLVPPGSVYEFLGEHRRRLFPEDMFVDLFPSRRGRPSVAGDVVATVMVLQSLEGLSDRDAVDALRTDLKWKVACGVALTDEGFHPTVLTLWRNRLRASDRPERIFDAVRMVVADTGVLAKRTRRALDSTLLDDAVATQDTVTQLTSVIRRVRKTIPHAMAVEVTAHDYDTPGKPSCAWDDPDARNELVTGLVTDALAILEAVDGISLDGDQTHLVALLALVAGQDVEPGDEEGTWRIARRVAKDRVISTVDPESRHMRKSRSSYRDGYKAHIAVEPETGIITACDLTPANIGDGPVGVKLLQGEEPGLDVLADSAYGAGGVRKDLHEAQHTAVIKPKPLPKNRRLGDDQFTRDDFIIDYQARTVTCPNNITTTFTAKGAAVFGVKCRGCPIRDRCTAAVNGKTFKVSEHDQYLARARAQWRQGTGIEDYRQHRPMVERSIAWLVANGNRRVKYRGVERNRLGLSLRAAAINLRRIVNLGVDYGPNGWALTT
jgi:IS5 family transposase